MALTVQQPERHAIFVGAPGDERGGTIHTIAVESANAIESAGLRIAAQAQTLT